MRIEAPRPSWRGAVFDEAETHNLMSRYSHTIEEGKSVAYGFDRLPEPGYFFQVWENGDLVREADTRPSMALGGQLLPRPDMAVELAGMGVPDEHHNRVMLDLPI